MEELSDAAEQVVEEKGDVAGRVRGDVREGLAEAVSGALGSDGSPDSSLLSRRSFMKTVAAGAVGLGAMALGPLASAFDVRSSDGLEVYETGTKYFDVQPGGPVQVTNTEFHVPDGSAASPSITFSNDTDTGIYRIAANEVGVAVGGTERWAFHDAVLRGSGGNVRMQGGDIVELGGTTAASAGAVRLANNTQISWRNAADTNDHNIRFDGVDDFAININSTNVFRVTDVDVQLQGNALTEVGGTTDAGSGAIRISNGSAINWRNSANSNDVGISVTASDNILTTMNGNTRHQLVSNGNLNIEGTLTESTTV